MPYTLEQLEAYVSSPAYDADTAGLLALGIPALKAATGQPGELLEPGVRRIRGNLCNVHGRYGPCDKSAAGKPKKPAKGRKPPKPKKTDAQRAQERTASQAARQQETTRQQALNMTKVGEATGLEDHLANLDQFGQGKPLRPQDEATLIEQGLMERGADGTARMSEQGRVLVNAAKRGDVQRARDAMSRGRDQVSASAGRATARQERVTAAEGRKRETEAKRAQREQERAKREADRKRSASGGSKKPEPGAEKPLRVAPTKRVARSSAPSVGSVGGGSAPKPTPKPAPAKAPAKQIAPALQTAADQLSQGAEVSESDADALIRNGLARIVKGKLILTAAGQRVTIKAFRVFKDAQGRDRWVAQSSTAFQDRDKEIVSTKALADDVARADADGVYGPLRWWHAPNLDLGQCDFNAMHGRVLIESGTFYSATIAQKVARAAAGLEISLGFLHLPTEPDADGVFHHIRRFERSLVPRGKASNRFTAFRVKETIPMDLTKKEALKQLGFSDTDILDLEARASATEKAADDAQTAYKADEPLELPDLVINGVTYKAFPPAAAEEEVVEADAIGDMPMEEEADPLAPTLSEGDFTRIQEMIAQVMGALELEKKVAGHVQGLLAPYQQAQATKDAEAAETKEQIEQLTTATVGLAAKVAELTGDQPNVPYRASAAKDTVINDISLLTAAKAAADPDASDPWADIKRGLGLAQQ